MWTGDAMIWQSVQFFSGVSFLELFYDVFILFHFSQPFSGEDQLLSSPESPPRGPVSSEIEDSNCAMDKLERPSPISVLEPLFTDDEISPASTTSQPG